MTAMRVICSAGHVDHGKSSLVRALTGMEPDRFEEERRRGLTIDLGFAWTELDGHTVAFVDLPGHERFIANMLAGAGPVDMALFVVAADEGWKPQSQEHLDVLTLLAVPRGLVVVSKADLVDDRTLAATTDAVREKLRGSALDGAEIVACSAQTGSGLDTVRAALTSLLADAPPAADLDRPRLWVDRAFSVRGAGTVVTGTLTGGTLQADDDMALLPSGKRARIRGLQQLGQASTQALPGSRVAVNLQGVERRDVARGDVVARAEQWVACEVFEAWVDVLPGQRLDRTGAWQLHVGSARAPVTVIPVQGRPLEQAGAVRIELPHALPLAAGDRFVLREAGRWVTVAGGLVVDAAPLGPARGAQRAARTAGLAARQRAVTQDDRAALLAFHVREHHWAPLRHAAAACGLNDEDARAAARTHKLLFLADALVAPAAGAQWSQAVQAALRAYHDAQPLEPAAPKDVAVRAAQQAGCPAALQEAFLDALVRLGRVVAEGPGLRDPNHHVALDPAQHAARDHLLELLSAEPFAPPRLSEAAAATGAAEAVIKELVRRGELVRLGADLVVPPATVAAAAARLREAFPGTPFTAAQAKEAWATTRKYAVPLLEELDRRRITQRHGDQRTVLA